MSAGLDYPGVGPEHSLLLWAGRVRYEAATDDDSLAALTECCRLEGILPAIESAHAFAGAKRWAQAKSRQEHPHRTFRPRRQGHAHAAAHRAGGRQAMKPRERISDRHSRRRRGGTAIVAFITAGYPQREKFREHLTQVGNAADVVEIGVPFTDPMADGMTIQRSSLRGLAPGRHAALGAVRARRDATAEGAAAAHELSQSAAGLRLRRAGGGRGACRRLRLHRAGPALRRKRRLPRGAGRAWRGADPDGDAGDPSGTHGAAVRDHPGLRLRRDHDRHHRAHRRGAQRRARVISTQCGPPPNYRCAPASASAAASRWSSCAATWPASSSVRRLSK